MAYDPVLDAWIEAGKPTKEEIFRYFKDNQESFNSDIELLKQTAAIDLLDSAIYGNFNDYSATELQEYMPVFRAPVSGTITSFVFSLLETSGAGTLGIELEKSTDNGANWNPLLTGATTLTGTTAGSLSGAVNFINVAAQSFNQNDLIRIKIDTIKTSQGAFHVSLYGELA
jgi:hypothetical protein